MNTKRIIALIICAVMVLSMIPVAALSTSAADVEGDWTTYRFAGEYPQPDEDIDEDTIYKPEAGYTYTDEGFTVVPADYKGFTPSMSVITKEKQSVKDGIYLQFRIDDYSYDGGTGADQWIALSLGTGDKTDPGNVNFGGGWVNLIRGAGNGACIMLPHLTDPKTEDFGGTWKNIGSLNGSVPMDDEGREIYTFEVTWTGSEYEMKINGVVQPGAADATALLEKLDPNGDFYVSINVQSKVADGTAALTILKYGTSEADATTPVGSDSKTPEDNQNVEYPVGDPTTIEANQPAILWSPETINIKGGNNCSFTVLGDNTWRVNGTDSLVYFSMNPKRSWVWNAEDFPVFGILLRNFGVDGGKAWYAAGDVMSPQNDCTWDFSVLDGEFYGENEEYVFIPIDLEGLWEGKINCVRLDMTLENEAVREFDICFAGMFRSEAEGFAYAENYLKSIDVIGEDYTRAPETTKAPETDPVDPETNADTAADTTADTNAGNNETEAPKEGCGSVIGFGAVAVLAAAAAAVALKKKD